MKLIIEVDEQIYRQAILDGWNRRTGEKATLKDIGSLDNKDDLVWAFPELSTDDFELEVEDY